MLYRLWSVRPAGSANAATPVNAPYSNAFVPSAVAAADAAKEERLLTP
jgi:hypothetical protein